MEQQLNNSAETKLMQNKFKLKTFFKAIYDPLIEPGGILKDREQIRLWQSNDEFQRTKYFDDIDDLVNYATTHRNIRGMNTYFTLSTTNGESGKEEDLMTRTVLGFDFDKKALCEGFNHKDIIGLFKSIGLWYHAIIDSGHGYHAYICIEPTSDINKVMKVTKVISEKLGADPAATKSTQLLRVPQTYNIKDLAAIKQVKIIHIFPLDTIKRYDIDNLHERFCGCEKRQSVGDRATKSTLNNTNVPRCISNILEQGSSEGSRYEDLQKIVVTLRGSNRSLGEIMAVCKEWASKSNYDDNLEYRVEHIYNNRKGISLDCKLCGSSSACGSTVESEFSYPDGFNLLEMTETHTKYLQTSSREGLKVMQGNDLLVYSILKNHSDGLFRDEIIHEMTYRGECRISKNILSKALNNLERNNFITVETIDRKKFYRVKEMRSKVDLTYGISYAATYEAVKGNITAEELRVYNYMRYLHNKQQREDPKALKGNLLQVNQKDLADALGLSQPQISRMISNLLEEKLLSIWHRQKSRNNNFEYYIYRLNY